MSRQNKANLTTKLKENLLMVAESLTSSTFDQILAPPSNVECFSAAAFAFNLLGGFRTSDHSIIITDECHQIPLKPVSRKTWALEKNSDAAHLKKVVEKNLNKRKKSHF